jgi:glycosyltransferase involved in cell wall biosynthesis
MPSIAFVTNIVPAYRYPVFDRVRKVNDFQVQILVTRPLTESCAEAVANLPIKHSAGWTLSRTIKHRLSGAMQREPLSIPLGLASDLLEFRPDVIVSGDLGVRSLVCWCVARLSRARFVLSSEEIASSAVGRSKIQHWLRKFLIKRADGFLAWGDPARQYLLSFNVSADRIFTSAQAIDNDFWLRQAQSIDRQNERSRLGLQGTTFLLVGRTLQGKGLQNFLEAWSRLPPELHASVSAIIVGDGTYLTELKNLALRHGLRNVDFVGAKSPPELARFYAAADIFVAPSLIDVWGMVINEAMCFGLPVLASKYAGASQALIENSDLGIVFDPTDIDDFVLRLRTWSESPPSRALAACHLALRDITFDRSSTAIQQMIANVARVPS